MTGCANRYWLPSREHLPRPVLERAVDLARRLHGGPRALALAELGHALPDWELALREEALAEARGLAQPFERAETLTRLLAEMPEELRPQPAGQALPRREPSATPQFGPRCWPTCSSSCPRER